MAEKSLYQKLQDRTAARKKAEKAEQKAAQQKTEKPVRDVGMIEDVAKSLVSGIFRGVTGIAGMGGDIEQLARLETGRLEEAMPSEATAAMPYASLARQVEAIPQRPMVSMDKPTMLPTSKQVYRGLESTVLPEGTLTYQPQTGAGRTFQMGGEFFGGGLAPVGKAKTMLKGSTLMGGVGTTAGGVSEFSPEAGLAVGLMGGGLTSLLRGKRTGTERMMADIVGEQTPAKIAEARRLQTAGQEIGVPLTAAETLNSQPLRTLAASVAAHPEGGGILGEFVRRRKESIEPAITTGILDVEPAPIDLPLAMTREAAEAAEKATTLQRKIRTRKTRDLYESGKKQSLEPDQVQDIIDQAMKIRGEVGTESRQVIDSFIRRIQNKDGSPVTKISVLEDEFKLVRNSMKMPQGSEGAVSAARKELSDLNNALNEAIKTNPDMKAAKARYQEATPEVVRIVDDSGLAAIEKASKPETIVDVITNINNATPESIGIVAKQLNKQDKAVFPKIARHWFDRSVKAAMKPTTQGEESLSSGVKFVNAVRRDPQILNSVLDGVASAKGVNPAQLKEGFNKMLDVLQRTNLIDSMGSPTATRGATEQMIAANAPAFARALGMDVTAPAKKISDRLIDSYRAKAYKNIANALVADDSISAIMAMAKTDAGSRQLQGLVTNIINPVREISQPMQPEGQELNPLGLLAQ